eukprot:scaffold24197_cov63-Phaeocystis_antarctica.AAC.2
MKGEHGGGGLALIGLRAHGLRDIGHIARPRGAHDRILADAESGLYIQAVAEQRVDRPDADDDHEGGLDRLERREEHRSLASERQAEGKQAPAELAQRAPVLPLHVPDGEIHAALWPSQRHGLPGDNAQHADEEADQVEGERQGHPQELIQVGDEEEDLVVAQVPPVDDCEPRVGPVDSQLLLRLKRSAEVVVAEPNQHRRGGS